MKNCFYSLIILFTSLCYTNQSELEPFSEPFNFLLRPTAIRLDRLDGKCDKYPDAPMYLDGIELFGEQHTSRINLYVKVLRELNHGYKMIFNSERCENKLSMDTCVSMPEVPFKDVCGFFYRNDAVTSPLISSLKPNFHCPFRAGTYSTVNGTLDSIAVGALPIEEFYWQSEIKIVDSANENLVLFCSKFNWQVIHL